MPARTSVEDARAAAQAGTLASTPYYVVAAAGCAWSAPLPSGRYDLISNAACFARQVASNAINVTDSNAHYIASGETRGFSVEGANDTTVAVYCASDARVCLSRR